MAESTEGKVRASGKDAVAHKRVQMVDIARLTGVSPSTVSRALNNSPLVNEETRKKIGELVKSLNYSINVGAQNLRLGQNKTIAVVVPYERSARQHISGAFFLGLVGALADALTARGYEMLLSRIDAEQIDQALNYIQVGRAAGLILVGQWHYHDRLNELAEQHLPIVVWGAQMPGQLYCSVGSDNVAGGYYATAHLIERGRRQIAFLGDWQYPEVAQRLEGYRKALAEAGIEARDDLCIRTPFVAESGRSALNELIHRKAGIDAVFACSDVLAMTSIGALNDAGLRVPDDVAVVGYDDVPVASYFQPALTTVHQPVDLGGEVLVESLLKLLNGEDVAAQALPTKLVVRASS